MARRFINIKPVDSAGEKPDRPSDEVLWSDLENCWFDKGILRKRPAYVAPATYTAIAATGTASPLHSIVQYNHPVAVDAEETVYPDGAGDHTDWTAVAATNNYQRVDEIVTDDTDYVYATTSGATHKDSYAFAGIGSVVVIDKLTFNIRARRHTVGDYTITLFCRTAANADKDIVGITGGEAATTLTIPQAGGSTNKWEDYTFEADTDPHTSAAWTVANVNAYEFGYYATFAAVAASETLQPDSDGNDSDWTSTGANYYGVLATNASAGTPSSWTSYIYEDTNSSSVSLNFAAGTHAFSTITSVEPKVWTSCWGGSRELRLYVDDNSSIDAAYVGEPYLTGGPPARQDYDDYVDLPHVPEQAVWRSLGGTLSYAIDPVTESDWSAGTIFTYDWNLKTTTTEQGIPLQMYRPISAFTTATDWVFKHTSVSIGGTASCTDVGTGGSSGEPFGSGITSGSGAKSYVRGTVTGDFDGTIYGDRISVNDTVEMSLEVEGTMTETSPGSGTMSGTLKPKDRAHQPVDCASSIGCVRFDDDTNQLEAKFDYSGTIACTMASTSRGYVTLGTTSITATPYEGVERIADQTLWDTDWLEGNAFRDPHEDLKKDSLFRDQYDQGAYPLELAITDLASLNYKEITNVGLGVIMTAKSEADAPELTAELSTTLLDAFVFPTDNYDTSTAVRTAWSGSPATETNVNADVFQVTADSGTGDTTSEMQIFAMTQAVRFKPYPEKRVYRFELKITGTAGPQPAVAQFNITAEGATGTARRESRLLVSQTDFYRANTGAATLIDVVGGATAPTVTRTQRWDTCKFFGKQYFTNGVDNIYKYPDATDTVDDIGGEAPKAYTIASFIGRLFCGCTTEGATFFPTRVRWSVVEDDQEFTNTGSGYIDLDDTDGKVVKLLPLGGTLVAYKETSLFNLHPTGDRQDAIVKQLISPGIGAAAMATVLSVVGRDGLPAHIFLGQGHGGYNVYIYTGNLLTPIGDDIKEELRDNLNPRQAQNAFAILDNKRNQYMFFVAYTGETFPHRAWLYDIDTGDWKHWTVPEVTCAGHLKAKEEFSDTDQWTMFLGLGDSLGRWMDPDTNADEDGVNVAMTIESGDWAVEKRETFVTLYRLHIHYYDQGYTKLKVSASTDGGDTYSTETDVWIGQSDGSADDSLRVAYADLMKTGKRFRIKIVHDADAAIKISEIQMEIEEQGWIV